MPPAEGEPSLRHAVALGLLQGPAELLPISSSAHTTLAPWLLGWRDARDGAARKSLEVSLHGGATIALAIAMRGELRAGLAELGARRATTLVALSAAPAALAGLALREVIERRLGGPRATALGLAAGAVAMALGDARGARQRKCAHATASDAIVLGLAQAAALVPGVSRSGATLAAARARGFGPASARRLSWGVALPVLAGASAFETLRLLRGRTRGGGSALAGATAAFLSTLASARLLARRAGSALLPYAVYRCALAGVVLLRLRRAK